MTPELTLEKKDLIMQGLKETNLGGIQLRNLPLTKLVVVSIYTMKHFLLLFVLITGCTQKYADYDLIRKVDFNKETYERPITLTQIAPVGQDHLKSCFNQWLFFSNAEKEKNEAIPYLVRSLCPGQDYLLQAEMVETWWTTLFFTRACVDVETKCAEARKK